MFQKDDYFGEISFFGDVPRICSGKSRDFTDVYSITKYDFLELTGGFPSAIVNYLFILFYVCRTCTTRLKIVFTEVRRITSF